jgi:hypothetical protein
MSDRPHILIELVTELGTERTVWREVKWPVSLWSPGWAVGDFIVHPVGGVIYRVCGRFHAEGITYVIVERTETWTLPPSHSLHGERIDLKEAFDAIRKETSKR